MKLKMSILKSRMVARANVLEILTLMIGETISRIFNRPGTHLKSLIDQLTCVIVVVDAESINDISWIFAIRQIFFSKELGKK